MKARRSMVNHRNTFKYTSPLLLTNKRFTIQHSVELEDQENIAPPRRMDQSASIKRRKLYDGQAVDVTPPIAVKNPPTLSQSISHHHHQPMDMDTSSIITRPFVFTPPASRIPSTHDAHQGSLSTPRRTPSIFTKSSIQEVMRVVTVYVEVMTIDEDRSDKIKSVAAAMGAQVNDKLYKNTTHVIFREGSMTTYKKALKMNIPLVSVTWLEECRKTLSVADPALFPPINLEPYERPDLYKRVRKAVPSNGDVATTPERFALKPTRPEDDLEKALLEYQQTKLRLEGADSPSSTPPPRSASQLGRTCLNFSPIGESTKIVTAPKTPSSQSSVTPLLRRLMIRNAEEDRRERGNLMVGRTNRPLPAGEETRFDRISMDLSSMWGQDPEPEHQRTDNRIVSMVEESTTTVDLTGASPESEIPPTSSRPSNTTSSIIKALRRQTLLFTQNATMDISPKAASAAVKENVPGNDYNATEEEEEEHETVPKICKAQRKSLEEDTLRDDIVRAKEELLGRAVVINKSDKRRSLLPMSMDTTEGGTSSLPPVNKPLNRRRTLFNVAAISEGGLTVDDPKKAKSKQATKRRTLAQTPISSSLSSAEEVKKLKTSVDVSPMKQQQQPQRQSMAPSQMQRRATINMGPPPPTSTGLTKGKVSTVRSSGKAMENGKKAGEGSAKTKPPPPVVDVPKKRKLFNSGLDLSPVSSPVHSKMKLLTEPFSPHTAQVVKKKVENNAAVKMPERNKSNRRSTLDFQPTTKTSFANATRSTNSSSASAMSLGSGDSSSGNKQRIPKNVIVLTNGQPKHLEFIKELVKRLGGSGSNYEVDTRVTSRTTHLVCFYSKRNMNMLRGVIRGVWLLDYEWITQSDVLGRWQREEDFEVKTFGNTLTRVRSERQAFGSNYKMELFSGTGQYYVYEMATVPVHHVKELIMLCGGIVVDQARDAKYLIGDKAQEDVQVISPSWVFDCVCHYAFLNHKKYVKKERKDLE